MIIHLGIPTDSIKKFLIYLEIYMYRDIYVYIYVYIHICIHTYNKLYTELFALIDFFILRDYI